MGFFDEIKNLRKLDEEIKKEKTRKALKVVGAVVVIVLLLAFLLR